MSLSANVQRALVFIGGAAVLAVTVAAVIGVAVVQRGFGARDEPSALEAFAARAIRLASIPRSAKLLVSPLGRTAEVLDDGKAHWADHCASCHANNGNGDTEMGRNMFPKPPDMRGASTQALTDGELYYIIKNGIRLTGMPAWGEPGDEDKETWALVVFIRHLPELTPEEEVAMKKLNPVSAHELLELREEEEFLRGGETKSPEHDVHKGEGE